MPNKLHSKRYRQQTDRANCCCTIKKRRPCSCYGETETGGDDRSDSLNMSGGSEDQEGRGQGSHQTDLEEEQMAVFRKWGKEQQ
ncbi:unnamed protein product [Brassica rapa]|uniref:Uncharacterized protein n=1 Tax=Brassica campestris TaxID=3711 RepID=A0A3P5ZM28_BRACM|nr:unnamed protein product [Brassica rapa]VDC76494.1 unnamed protein product [Brassica rapa]